MNTIIYTTKGKIQLNSATVQKSIKIQPADTGH